MQLPQIYQTRPAGVSERGPHRFVYVAAKRRAATPTCAPLCFSLVEQEAPKGEDEAD